MQIIIKLTTNCNLNCVYCSEGKKEKSVFLPKEIFYKLVDELPKLLESINDQTVDFLFHGGEPMLYGREGLLNLINYAKSNLKDIDIKFSMQTNGTLIDDEWIKFFKEHKISIGISLDGYPEIHNTNRKTKSGEPTAEKIINNIELLKKEEINIGTLMVLNSQNVDVNKLFEFIQKHDIQPKINPIIPCGCASDRKDTDEIYKSYIELLEKLLPLALKDEKRRIIQPLDEILNTIIGISPMTECSYSGSCGKKFISLYPDGQMGFCGRDNESRKLIYGDLKNSSLLELYNSENAKKIRARQDYLKENDCKGCSDWELCHGGCAFEAVNTFGKLESKFVNCKEYKEFIKYLSTDGLKMLKSALTREKTKRRNEIKEQKVILDEMKSIIKEVISAES